MRGGGSQERVARLENSEEGHAHVLELEARPLEIEPQAIEPAPAHPRVKIPSLEEERHPGLGRAPDDHRLGAGLLSSRHGGSAADDGRLLRGDGLDGVAQVGLVIEVDAAHDLDGRAAHRGRVEPPPQADLEHRHLDSFTGEVIKGECGQRLEHGRVEAGHQGAERFHAVGEIGFGDRAVDANALADIDEVGRGVEPDSAPRGLEDGRQHGAHRALAIGAADLDQGHRPLGVARRLEQRLDALEAGAHPGHLAAPQPGDAGHGLAVGHGAGWDGPAKKARMRRRVSRSSRRSITRSSWPCSRRNSERWKPSGSGWRIVSAMTRGPAKPMSARGSARITSPSMAKLAVTPPVVGSVSTETKGNPCSPSRCKAADVFAICISERMPSCMRAPPEADTMMTGRCLAMASSIARVSFSPTAEPMLPPRYAKSKAASTTGQPPSRPTPVMTASALPVFSRAARTRSR